MFRSRFEIYQTCMIPKARARVPNAIKLPRALENLVKRPKDPFVQQMEPVAYSVSIQSPFNHVVPILETKQPKRPFFYDMRIQESDKCGSKIAKGLCLGKKSCTYHVSEAMTTNCSKSPKIITIDRTTNITQQVGEVQSNDESEYSNCQVNKSRAMIVNGRCFATRIVLSGAWSLKIIGWDSISAGY
ncbi:hypothetical protein PsorP6_003858 [Peronosclerospora sorghi]|uniref:Uncharacterized protein n=1 Tax=Peronosclerospora sorghi TaxID=230839 RepID=A0ACC0VP68_9STRA|nr:hypothetical protein PsorP6_003858 [Peronosclerospora sorghi]